jgi:hypothetical protein
MDPNHGGKITGLRDSKGYYKIVIIRLYHMIHVAGPFIYPVNPVNPNYWISQSQ